MITDTLNNIKGNFCSRVEGVKKLSVLENLIIDQTISILEQRQQNLKNTGIENAQLLGESSLLSLRNIRTNESLSPAYELLNNQCIVLLISYFSSTMHDIFNAGVTFILRKNQFPKLPSTELKLTLKELHELDFNLQQEIGSIISKKI